MSGILGLTDEQAAAVEAATLLADPVRHDGLILAVAAALGAGPTWTNAQVSAAIGTALVNCSGRNVPPIIANIFAGT